LIWNNIVHEPVQHAHRGTPREKSSSTRGRSLLKRQRAGKVVADTDQR
jgi:hypothetical protein